ncbi:TRANSDUCIN/WD40 REPEAT-LIKE SUPERFAMILY PROTEIN [Salix koriyanagi]|uniref:TRANSDUCIN/WD40 REPEAT-LIKE SUPERFAMILY PROTEIN n=1 Tax=Salix koriyanagi TaxID=2511006 RepID=A0A9Q0VE99_9ROSI|nr:TRANSDUCIN/WD40 REPEAT-LIKE SUPERFAMILY PROTEIN [Salix koriyanagi]
MERKRTLTMNWDALGDHDHDDDDRFFETYDRLSSSVSFDLNSSGSDEDDDFDDTRMSFASAMSSLSTSEFRNYAAAAATLSPKYSASVSPDYDIWKEAPGSITERRKRLLQGMGLNSNKELLKMASKGLMRDVTSKNIVVINGDNPTIDHDQIGDTKQEVSPSLPLPVLLVRSRSDGDIESLSVDRKRKEELFGLISKQRLTRTSSMIIVSHGRIFPSQDSNRLSPKDARSERSVAHSSALTSILSNSRFGAFFLIKNLDTGKEFIVNEYDQDGMWNRLSDLQTGKQLTMEEFEKCVGHSPVVKELMRRENVSRLNVIDEANDRKISANSYLSKSLRVSKRRGAALLKNIKGVAYSMSMSGSSRIQDPKQEPKLSKNSASSGWIKVRQTGKSYKELSALHLCQEIQAHQGSIWTIRFSSDARFLASGGEDKIIHIWEVQECEIMSLHDGNLTPLHPSLCSSTPSLGEVTPMSSERKKKSKASSSRKGNPIPEYVHVPETVFSLSEKPVCSFSGHLDDVLDLSWSRSQLLLSSSMDKTVRLWDMETKSCLKLFAHNDYVTCIQFNPMDERYFISGSLDAKVRIWSIPDRQLVDWTDLHEMVTAVCYTPDGQGALVGSHKGSCRMYNAEDCKLSQVECVDVQNKKRSQAKKITGFQFSPGNPSEVLVTSADSRVRILDGSEVVHKFRGFRNINSQISASFSSDGKYVVSASEDSHVYIWKRDEPRPRGVTGKGKSVITTRSQESFQCRDVSVAIPWNGTVKGDPPPLQLHSKRQSKRSSAASQPPSATSSPTKEDAAVNSKRHFPPSANDSPTREENSPAKNSKRHLPPLPRKNSSDRSHTAPEEYLSLISHSDSGLGESFASNSSSIRYGDSPSISAAPTPSSSWSSSWLWFDGGSHGKPNCPSNRMGLGDCDSYIRR